MNDEHKTKGQLRSEIAELRKRLAETNRINAELEAMGTQHKRVEEMLRVQRDLALTLGSTHDLTEALNRMLEITFQIEGFDCGGVYQIDSLTGGMNLAAHKGLSRQFVESISLYDADSPNTQLVMGGNPFYLDVSQFPPDIEEVNQCEGIRALAVIPVEYQGQIIASLHLASHTHDDIPDVAREVLRGIAAQFGGVIVRINAEQALRESTEKIRAMYESMTDGITFADKEGRIMDSNEAAVRMHEYESKEDLIGRSAFDLIAESDQTRALEIMQKTLETDRSGVIEYKLVTKTGREFDGELNAVLLRDEQGNPSAFVALTRDISKRKRAEEALQESEEKYSMLFNEMLTGLSLHEIILDDNGKPIDYRFLDVNPAFEEHTGLKKEDLVGRTVLEVLPGTEPIWIETSGEVALGGEPMHFEQFSAEIGKYYEVLTFCPKKGQFATLSSDITERKKIEEELERHREHLEELVEERTRELETTNQELETFAFSISHDLRSPLRAINGFSAILQDKYSDVLDEMGMDYLNKVRSSGFRMSQLIDDLLALSRLGRNELQLMTINLTHITKRIFAEIIQDESERNFDFQIMELPLVEVDEKLTEVLLTNLLTNAVKFTRGRAPAIIEFGFLPEEETPTFYIRDNGVGFDMKYADKLFTPFQRLHTEKEFEGTGIGLAIVQRVVRRHGGRIWVEAELDKGATFFFTLQP